MLPGPVDAQPTTTRVSVGPAGTEGNASSSDPAISHDGRWVAFASQADNLVPGDTNEVSDVFVHDRLTATTTRISVGPGGTQADDDSSNPSMSADGRWVAFYSFATNLVVGDSNGFGDVFVHDRQTATTTRVSVGAGSAQANGASYEAAISADGRWVVFLSFANNLVGGDSNGFDDAFVHDRQTGATTLVSVGVAGAPGNGDAYAPAISAAGRFVAFESFASNLVVGDTNGTEDVFVRDLQTGTTTRVSVGPGGVQGNSDSFDPAISADGRSVAFRSLASNLVAGDTNGYQDVFVHDRQTATTTRVSVGPGGTQGNGDSYVAAISADGRWVGFESDASNLVTGDTNGAQDAFVYDWQTGTTLRVSVGAGGAQGDADTYVPVVSADGRYVAFDSLASNLVGADLNDVGDVFVHDRGAGGCVVALVPATVVAPPGGTTGNVVVTAPAGCAWTAVSSDPSWLAVTGGANGAGDGTVSYSVAPNGGAARAATLTIGGPTVVVSQSGDVDGDGLPDDWETRFGLSVSSGIGIDGASGDPDGDGVTNLGEYQAGTHPRGFFTRYLAEGAINAFFDVRLALLNVGTDSGRVLLRFLQPGGAVLTLYELLPTARRRTLTRADLSGLSSPDFSTVVESDQPLVVDRTMSWDASGYGSHAESSVASPAMTWYLAEGSTSGDFALFYLLQNPNPTGTTATVRYLRPSGQPPIERQYGLAANSRTTIAVDAQGPELASTDLSAVITAPIPIIVERAMYMTRLGQVFAAGHGSAGVTAPATSWFLAEGATGPFFDLFILLANPSDQVAQVTVDYLLLGGTTFTKSYSVPANGRFTIWVDNEEIPAGSGTKPLDNVAVSSTITSSNGVPIIVERAMWWPSPALSAAFWIEAHNSPGATATATRWALAEGEVGGPQSAETYILIANTSLFAGSARVLLVFEDGTSDERTFALPARSRTNVGVSVEFPGVAGKRFGAIVESMGATPAQIVVERAMYTSPGGVTWAAGTERAGHTATVTSDE